LSRWKSVLRGILGMGLTFGGIAGGFFAALTAVLAVFGGLDEGEPFFPIIAGTVWGFGIGVAFSMVLAVAGRHVSFEKLSVPRVASIGALAGFLLAGTLIGVTSLAGEVFTGVVEALTILPILGAGAGTASLLIARRSGPALSSGEEAPGLRAGGDVDEAVGQ